MPVSAATPDQASRLRELARRLTPQPDPPPVVNPWPLIPAVAVTGGKGGVGKTCVAVNLAVALAKLGARTLLVDMDLGLANADLLLGVDPAHTLREVILGQAPASAAITQTPFGCQFLAADSGLEEFSHLDEAQLLRLFNALAVLSKGFDVVVLDTPAGIGREVMAALRCARVVLPVVTPDPASITDVYALIKVLEQQQAGKDVRILVNQAANGHEAAAVYAKLAMVTRKHLARELVQAGVLPRDPALADSVRRRRPLCANPGPSLAADAIRSLASRLRAERW